MSVVLITSGNLRTDVCCIDIVFQRSPYVNQIVFGIVRPLVQNCFGKIAILDSELNPNFGFLRLQERSQLPSCIKRQENLSA